MTTFGVVGRHEEYASVKVKRTAPGTYLVYRTGQDPVTGIAVYEYAAGRWECERCGSAQHTIRPDCEHVELVRKKVK